MMSCFLWYINKGCGPGKQWKSCNLKSDHLMSPFHFQYLWRNTRNYKENSSCVTIRFSLHKTNISYIWCWFISHKISSGKKCLLLCVYICFLSGWVVVFFLFSNMFKIFPLLLCQKILLANTEPVLNNWQMKKCVSITFTRYSSI